MREGQRPVLIPAQGNALGLRFKKLQGLKARFNPASDGPPDVSKRRAWRRQSASSPQSIAQGQVSGAGGTTGVALVEVYEMP